MNEALSSRVDRIVDETGFSGIVHVARADRIVYARASGLADRLASFAVKFLTVGAFRTDEGVVFLAPEDSSALRGAHEHMIELLGAESALIDAHYRPAAWFPHCTVAFNVPRATLDTIIEACQPHAPLQVTVRRLSAVRYRPANTIHSAELA